MAGAAAGAFPGGAATGVCAKPVTAPRRLAQINSALIISLHPAAAAAREDYSRTAAPSSRIPTKQHHPHHPNLKIPKALRQAAAVPASKPAGSPEVQAVPAASHLPSHTVQPIAASSLRSP